MNKETTDQLRIAAANGLKFEFQGNKKNFSDYLNVIDIVGSHQKSEITMHRY